MQSKTIIVVASARREGNTKKAAAFLKDTYKFDIVDILDYNINPYDYHHNYDDHDQYYQLVELIITYDNILFATPVYWYSMSAQLKTFFDRITDLLKIKKDLGRQLRGKSMGLISCSGSNDRNLSFTEPFELSAGYLGMTYLGDKHVWLDGHLTEEAKDRLRSFGRAL